MRAPPLIAAILLMATACSTPAGNLPSLQPRASEGIDPRLPVAPLSSGAPASEALNARLAELVRQGRSGDAAFAPAMVEAERLARAAGVAQGESWIAAQQALSAAAAARSMTTRALGDIDAIAAQQLEQQSTISPADLAAVREAAATVGAIDRRQHARLTAVARALGL